MADANNNQLHFRVVSLAPHQNIQFNDIFATFGITPQDGVTVNIQNGGPEVIYGYASMVRNDSGDPIFMFGTGPNT